MSLDAAFSIATSSLLNVNRQLALVSQNVANAQTAGYARERAAQESLTAAGIGMGVRSGPAQRDIDATLQAGVLQQNGAVAGLAVRQGALQSIDAAQGTPGQGSDLPSLLGKLQDAFSTLAGSPQSTTQQQATVSAAASLAGGINALSAAYAGQRQAAQDAIVADVAALNAGLGAVAGLTRQIVALRGSGQSTADLENQRDSALNGLSQIVDMRVLAQGDGNVVLVLGAGLSPSLQGATPFSTGTASIGPGAYYPGGGIPSITLGGADVAAQLTGGRLGAELALRDATLPTYQARLDEFAQTLAGRFEAQGLRLFTDPTGSVPAGAGSPVQAGYVGFAAQIGVNPAVSSNPALVRDGTQAVVGSPTGASAFTPNPSGGPAGFTTLIGRVLDYALGTEVRAGVAQPAVNTQALGPAGGLASPYAGTGALGTLAVALVGAQSQDSAETTGRLGTEQALQTTLQNKLSSQSGVSIDAELSQMLQLQTAYSATARVIGAAQSMWDQLIQAVR